MQYVATVPFESFHGQCIDPAKIHPATLLADCLEDNGLQELARHYLKAMETCNSDIYLINAMNEEVVVVYIVNNKTRIIIPITNNNVSFASVIPHPTKPVFVVFWDQDDISWYDLSGNLIQTVNIITWSEAYSEDYVIVSDIQTIYFYTWEGQLISTIEHHHDPSDDLKDYYIGHTVHGDYGFIALPEDEDEEPTEVDIYRLTVGRNVKDIK